MSFKGHYNNPTRKGHPAPRPAWLGGSESWTFARKDEARRRGRRSRGADGSRDLGRRGGSGCSREDVSGGLGSVFATGSRAGRTRRRSRERQSRNFSMREPFAATRARTPGDARPRPVKARTRSGLMTSLAGKATNQRRVASRRAMQARQTCQKRGQTSEAMRADIHETRASIRAARAATHGTRAGERATRAVVPARRAGAQATGAGSQSQGGRRAIHGGSGGCKAANHASEQGRLSRKRRRSCQHD
jgi:hypothetical protein